MQTSSSLERMSAAPVYDDTDSGAAVSWPSIFGGVAAAVALTFVLLSLGSGFGWASLSAAGGERASGSHFKYMVAIWLVLTQWISSALGGYLTGRLRTRWNGVHTHEVFFRDTAHGFLVWAVATILYTAIVAFAASSGAQHGPNPGDDMRNGIAISPESESIDSLFRANGSGPTIDRDTRIEADHIIWKGARAGSLSSADESYLAQLINTRTGASTEDATKDIDTTVAALHQSIVNSGKAAATLSLFTCLSMLIGAFIACVGAALGGLERDMPRPATP